MSESEIEKKVSEICKILGVPNDADVIHAYAQAYLHGYKNIICLKAPENYYDVSLEERKEMIGSPCQNVSQLTKCLLYENKIAPEESRDMTYSRYYMFIYQYERKFSEPKFHTYLKNLKKSDPKYAHLTKSSYAYKFVDETVAEQLVGSKHNGMSPIGLVDRDVPIILDEYAAKQEQIFVGGLHPLVKVRVNVSELLSTNKNITVALITDEGREK